MIIDKILSKKFWFHGLSIIRFPRTPSSVWCRVPKSCAAQIAYPLLICCSDLDGVSVKMVVLFSWWLVVLSHLSHNKSCHNYDEKMKIRNKVLEVGLIKYCHLARYFPISRNSIQIIIFSKNGIIAMGLNIFYHQTQPKSGNYRQMPPNKAEFAQF